MRIRTVAALGLMAVGIGAIVAVTVAPGFGATSSSTRYITSRATVTNVVDQVAATGNLAAATTFTFAFGSAPSTGAASSSSSGTGSSNSGSTTEWTVATVTVKAGQVVKAGDILATADPSTAKATLTIAQANLAAAQARLKTDKAGPTKTDKAAAKVGVTQAQQSLSNARTSYSQTVRQNNLKLSQARSALARAQKQLKTDRAATPPVASNVISQDKNAITQASESLASLKLQVAQSNASAANQVNSAKLAVTSAGYAYTQKLVGATAATIASDQAAVTQAQQTVTNATQALQYVDLVAPADGIVLTVNITPGTAAPSGSAITVRSTALQVSATVSESDLPSLKLGQAVTVTLTALGKSVEGTVSTIDQSGSAASSGGVVSYGLVVTLTNPPAGAAPGMSAQVSITTQSAENVLAVPAIALQTSSGQYTVRVLDAAGQPQSVPVEVGLVTSSLAEIKSGISEGTAVVTGTTSTRQGSTTTTGVNGGGLGGLGGGGGTRGGGQFVPGAP